MHVYTVSSPWIERCEKRGGDAITLDGTPIITA